MAAAFHGSLLLPVDGSMTRFHGHIEVSGKQWALALQLRGSKQQPAAIYMGQDLLELLKGHEATVRKQVEQASSLPSFLRAFVPLVQRLSQASVLCTTEQNQVSWLRNLSTAAHVVQQLSDLGWEKVMTVDDALRSIELVHADAKGRQHVLALQLAADHPRTAPQCRALLPEPFELPWSQDVTLFQVHASFAATVDSYQDLWDMAAELIESVRVIEPPHLVYSASAFRIALPQNASLNVQVQPRKARQLPTVQFLGPDHATRGLQATFAEHIDRWSPKLSLSENLKLILGRDYALAPRLDNEHPEDLNDDRECGICYTFKLNDELPDKVCEEPRCGRGFHPSCLAEWLHALPETRHSFGTLFGECPYCGTAISGLIKGPVAGADESEEGVAI